MDRVLRKCLLHWGTFLFYRGKRKASRCWNTFFFFRRERRKLRKQSKDVSLLSWQRGSANGDPGIQNSKVVEILQYLLGETFLGHHVLSEIDQGWIAFCTF